MRESDLIVSHRKHWLDQHPNDFYHKLHDAMGMSGLKPFDVFIINDGKTIAIEFKIHKAHTAFSLARIKPHQVMGLSMAARAGAKALVFVGVRFLADVDLQAKLKLPRRRINVDIELPIQDVVTLLNQGVKSIPVLPYLYGQPSSEEGEDDSGPGEDCSGEPEGSDGE